ncbi:MAG: hypothetical protein HOP04_10795 [Methylophilaceae bacterium]|nr:hypothetical protein [Methylophilaceae bacterium]
MVTDHSLPDGLQDHGYLKPTLRIFLSVDIVNSTSFKQAARGHLEKKLRQADVPIENDREEIWFSPIARFYRGIERKLGEEWRKRCDSITDLGDPGSPPTLWKASGDEVIYEKKLVSPLQALLTTRAWMAAVNEHRLELKEEFPILDLKASAWLAGFPVNNAEVVLRRTPDELNPLEDLTEGDSFLVNILRLKELHKQSRSDDGDIFLDFIGPSMDTGFRVSSLATPRKLAITIDLAYMVAHAADAMPKHISFPLLRPPLFQYDGRIPLKGVSDGAPYPFFWIDMKEDDAILVEEDKLTGRKRLLCAEVLPFCTGFFSEHHERGAFMTPYLVDEPTTSPFSHVPEVHKKRLAGLVYWAQELNKREEEKASQLAINEPTVPQEPASVPPTFPELWTELAKFFISRQPGIVQK